MLSGKVNGQSKDTILISDSKTFNGITIHKSTIQDAVNKFGKYSKVKKIISGGYSAYVVGGRCHEVNFYDYLYYFRNSKFIIQTPEKSDTIKSIAILAPFSAKTFDSIVLGKTILGEIILDTFDSYKIIADTFNNNYIVPNIYIRKYKGEEYRYVEYHNIGYGIKSKDFSMYCLKRKYFKMRIKIIVLG